MIASKKSTDIMQKRIPKNPKYENVESTIDTGASLSRYLRKVEEIRQDYRIRKDELFKRMKVATFVQLVLQVAEINNHLYCKGEEFEDGEETVRSTSTTGTHRSTFQGVIAGVGELDIDGGGAVETGTMRGRGDSHDLPEVDDMPYLLLDVRDRDEYDLCHIIKSMPYPSAMISRSVNFETKEMLACRNKPGRIIIVYDEDERLAPRVADTLVQRGYDNLFLLSGGLKVAYRKFPEGLITGRVPEAVQQAAQTGGKGRPRPPRQEDLTAGTRSQRSVLSGASATSSSAVPSEMKTEFSMDDLARLSLALDSAADCQSSTGSSVLSRQTRPGAPPSRPPGGSSLSIAASQVDHKKPFKC